MIDFFKFFSFTLTDFWMFSILFYAFFLTHKTFIRKVRLDGFEKFIVFLGCWFFILYLYVFLAYFFA